MSKSCAAKESRTLTSLLTGALKAPVSAIPPPRHVKLSVLASLSSVLSLPSAVCSSYEDLLLCSDAPNGTCLLRSDAFGHRGVCLANCTENEAFIQA
jgi:hypothetical protein